MTSSDARQINFYWGMHHRLSHSTLVIHHAVCFSGHLNIAWGHLLGGCGLGCDILHCIFSNIWSAWSVTIAWKFENLRQTRALSTPSNSFPGFLPEYWGFDGCKMSLKEDWYAHIHTCIITEQSSIWYTSIYIKLCSFSIEKIFFFLAIGKLAFFLQVIYVL